MDMNIRKVEVYWCKDIIDCLKGWELNWIELFFILIDKFFCLKFGSKYLRLMNWLF